jgi:hypothetical protein
MIIKNVNTKKQVIHENRLKWLGVLVIDSAQKRNSTSHFATRLKNLMNYSELNSYIGPLHLMTF